MKPRPKLPNRSKAALALIGAAFLSSCDAPHGSSTGAVEELPHETRLLIEEAFRVIALETPAPRAELRLSSQTTEWQVRFDGARLSELTSTDTSAGPQSPALSHDGQIVLPLFDPQARSDAEYVADLFHEWAHLKQMRAGWAFAPGDTPDCRLMVQEGEARAMEIHLAKRAAAGRPADQSLRQPIDYAALADALILSVEADRQRSDFPREQLYAEGAARWLASGLTPAEWRVSAVAYCGDASNE